MAKLRDVLPKEFFDSYMTVVRRQYIPGKPEEPSPAAKLLDVEVVEEISHLNNNFRRWPGEQKWVSNWWRLANGFAVGWNENPGKGWSFPVVGPTKVSEVL